MQLQAGYTLDTVFKYFKNEDSNSYDRLEALLCYLSHFDVKGLGQNNSSFSKDPLNAVAINILQRGLPTRLNYWAAKALYENNDFVSITENDKELAFDPLYDDNNASLLYYYYHFIDARINRASIKRKYAKSWEKLDSSFEEDFYFKILPEALGKENEFILQLITPQRDLSNILKNNKNISDQTLNSFYDQRVDFAIELPEPNSDDYTGIVIEVDGSQHKQPAQKFLDEKRDVAIKENGWHRTIRITTDDIKAGKAKQKLEELINFIEKSDFLQQIKHVYNNTNFEEPDQIEFLEMLYTPFGIARIQRVILEIIKREKLSLSDKKWTIAVLERDVPCAFLAFNDLKNLLENLYGIYYPNETFQFPELDLDIFSTPEFLESPLHSLSEKVKPIQQINLEKQYDVFIDISILQRSGINENIIKNIRENIIIRSPQFLSASRKVASAQPVKSPPFGGRIPGNNEFNIDNKEVQKNLEYLLKSIFRKKSFLPGQLEIINRAIQWKNVIGLLPTGGGKSLTYQLSALLQPGITLIVDPIKSLMKDQVFGLNDNMIDFCSYINSSVSKEERKKAQMDMSNGKALFMFVSPERLQIEEFRKSLLKAKENQYYFAYCVIDEAHCVSEWGHDFRTSYLLLGQNARKLCKTFDGEIIPLIGLTATASYDVLADVQRELSGEGKEEKLDENTIISFESLERDEIQYKLVEVELDKTEYKDHWELKKALSRVKQEKIAELLAQVPNDIQYFSDNPSLCVDLENTNKEKIEKIIYEDINRQSFWQLHNKKYYNAGLIFMPHKGWVFGITDKKGNGLYDKLDNIIENKNLPVNLEKGFFMGSSDDGDIEYETELTKKTEHFQNTFKDNDINLMIATKAFGMGIDKENVRYTIHFNYPQSIEGFVQESGRAGRDGKMAVSYIIFHNQEVKCNNKEAYPDREVNQYFFNNSFKGVKKELAIIDELLNNIYAPDKTLDLKNLIFDQLNVNVKVAYKSYENENHYLFYNNEEGRKLGYLKLNNLTSRPKDSVDIDLSERIFSISRDYIETECTGNDYVNWINSTIEYEGLFSKIKYNNPGKEFSLVIPFENNKKERLKKIALWLRTVIHKYYNEGHVSDAYKYAQNFNDFINNIEESYSVFTKGKKVSIKDKCIHWDKKKGKASGTTLIEFEKYYNGYREEIDTSRAIYRLLLVGVIDDYTMDHRNRTYTVKGKVKNKGDYFSHVKSFLSRYYGANRVKSLLVDLQSNIVNKSQAEEINLCIEFVVDFIYKQIAKKREMAITEMETACKKLSVNNNVEFKEYVHLYFNSKYAREDYYAQTESGEKFASLKIRHAETLDLDKRIELIWEFIDLTRTDQSAGEIDNVKHLRGACLRSETEIISDFVIHLLHAYTLYFLEFNNPRLIKIAEEKLIEGFILAEEEGYKEENKLKEIFNMFVDKLQTANADILRMLEKHGYALEFEKVALHKYVPLLENLNDKMDNLNKKLEFYGN